MYELRQEGCALTDRALPAANKALLSLLLGMGGYGSCDPEALALFKGAIAALVPLVSSKLHSSPAVDTLSVPVCAVSAVPDEEADAVLWGHVAVERVLSVIADGEDGGALALARRFVFPY